jgi:sarcosine oxidase subunit delta
LLPSAAHEENTVKVMTCPLNGPRNISEFVYGGEVVAHPDPHRCPDEEWTDFVFFENNSAGVVREWWFHAPTAYWFIAERNTVTDEIIRTYPSKELFATRQDFDRPDDAGKKKSGS